jgi:carbamoyltransferase
MNVGVRDGAAALGEGGRLIGVCAQERVSRVRGGPNPDGVPDQALDLLLQRAGRTRRDLDRLAWVGDAAAVALHTAEPPLGDHFAHACTAYLTSPFAAAAIVVCDQDAPRVSVWEGRDGRIAPVELAWSGPGFDEVYARCADALGFRGEAREQRFEALARLDPDGRDAVIEALLSLAGDRITVASTFEATVHEAIGPARAPDDPRRATVAAALQARLGDLLLEFLGEVRRRLGLDALCVGGGLFYHSSINTRLRLSGLFREVYVPVDPGHTGMAAGAVLHALGVRPSQVPAFLGPAYSSEETKEVLDNCKLQYAWETESGCIAAAVDALAQGRLVGWFDDAMEWGPRALGARSILANPFAPYVLENLNRFLKHRDPWRGYALSGLTQAVADHFDGPAEAPYMECDFRPRDRERFAGILPSPAAAVRVHTVSRTALPRFARLLEAVGTATGLPFLVNTSFNGFHEPSVCSPRDAVRVFYGSGLDLLVLNQFVLRK